MAEIVLQDPVKRFGDMVAVKDPNLTIRDWEPFGLNLLLMFFVGVGIGSCEGVTDALLLDLHPGRGSLYINVNHLFVTVGGIVVPAVMSLVSRFASFRWALGRMGR